MRRGTFEPPASFYFLCTVAIVPIVIVSVRSGELDTIVMLQAVSRISSVLANVKFVTLVLSLNSGCFINVYQNVFVCS